MQTWKVEYYGTGNLIRTAYFEAENRTEALKQFINSGSPCLELICCTPVIRTRNVAIIKEGENER